MSNKKYTPCYNAEFRERAVRMLSEQRGSYASDNAAYIAVGSSLGCSPGSLRSWCHQAQKDAGERPGLSTEDKARIKGAKAIVFSFKSAEWLYPLIGRGGSLASAQTNRLGIRYRA